MLNDRGWARTSILRVWNPALFHLSFTANVVNTEPLVDAAAGAPHGAAKTHGKGVAFTGRALRAPAGLHADCVGFSRPVPELSKRSRRSAQGRAGAAANEKGALPSRSVGEGRAPCIWRPGPGTAARAYTGPPSTRLPKSTIVSEPLAATLGHRYHVSSPRRGAGQSEPRSVHDDAVLPSTVAHDPATPRIFCEGASVRFWVAKEWACIVRLVVRLVRFGSMPGGAENEKRVAILRPPCGNPAGPGPMVRRPADEGRDSRWRQD
jgi:hypothetical protein